jgi:integrase/recombinase XerD
MIMPNHDTRHFRDLADWSGTSPKQLVETHLAKPANTSRGYKADLATFAKWLDVGELHEAAAKLVDGGRAAAKRLMIAWVNRMRADRLSASTIRRRVASIKSLLATAADPDIEIITWQVGAIKNLPAAARVRDCRGPDRQAVERMFAIAQQRGDPKGRRDEAVLSLLYYHALRASEVLSVRVEDVNLEATPASVRILGKTSQGRVTVNLCHAAAEAVGRWLEVRGSESGPLFSRCARWGRGVLTPALSYWGLRAVVRGLGETAGVRCWPHALRHAAITHLAMQTGDSAIWGTALSRHRDVRTWIGYQDRAVSHLAAAEVLSRRQIVRHDPQGADNQHC